MNKQLKKDIREQLITKTGKLNSAIIRRDKFKTSKLFKDIIDATKFIPQEDDYSIRERICYINKDISQIVTCKICSTPLRMKATGEFPNTCFKCVRGYYKFKSSSSTKLQNNRERKTVFTQTHINNLYSKTPPEDVLEFIKKRVSHTSEGVKSNFVNLKIEREQSDILHTILEETEKFKEINLSEISWSERFFLYLHQTKAPKCNLCETNYAKYINFKQGYQLQCSRDCRSRLGLKYITQHIEDQGFEIINIDLPMLKYSIFILKCKDCGKTHERELTNARWKTIYCSGCYGEQGISKGEKEVVDFVKSLGIHLKENDRTIITPKELDIYIPDKTLAIEYNGVYWHSETNKDDKHYHSNKTKLCAEKGIQLIHIFEHEWLERQEIVKSIIKSKLGIYERKLYARKCTLKKLLKHEKTKFLKDNHLQGNDNSKVSYGLFNNDELVALMSFGVRQITRSAPEWELIRFCSKTNTQVIGGASKLLKRFFEEYDPPHLKTYADLRYCSSPAFYEGLGFKLKHISTPNYWYVKGGRVFHRVNFQKHKLENRLNTFDSNLTEWENMQINGYDRIWDCGNFVFEKKYEQ